MSNLVTSLLESSPIISDQVEFAELKILLTELEGVLNRKVSGDIVEFGCYTGTTSLFISRMLLAMKSDKNLYVYDSFDGLPEKSKQDESPLGIDFKRGELRSTKATFIQNYRKANLPLPIITKKWFHEVSDEEVPTAICFAFLDGDYYKSIRSSLALVAPRISGGGRIIIDDYDNPKLPGAKRATEDFGMVPLTVKSSLAICTF